MGFDADEQGVFWRRVFVAALANPALCDDNKRAAAQAAAIADEALEECARRQTSGGDDRATPIPGEALLEDG
ncbi:hypothetical protein UFOVP650_80 [uncultured Caudovirales phage]|uniref:Uncharacterized protein n=1 Tax=uncultured Caudovirales phage TaxID=2100421 RepID=A0A6J5ND84_9CAUD|nr:hypothetical protein UFOVP650_80 [uncultured Caudovirales phage]